jgi:NAD(P)-dependent dehydrogenase (short-subunit alcohol dehydrogenase family)
MKTIFMTGTSTGLGKAAAILFAEKGWKVIATMRTPEKADKSLNYPNIIKMALDVTNLDQIKKTVKEAIEMGSVDVVFNNAGYGLAGPFEGSSDEQIQKNITTNLLGVMRVTKEFIQHFRENNSGLFITTTSIGGSITLPFNTVYHATKFGLEGWSECLNFELQPFGISSKTVAPGGIATDFAGRSLDLVQHEAYDELMNKVLSVYMDPERANLYSTAEQIAEVVYEAATDENNDKVKYIAGKDAIAFYARRKEVGSISSNKELKEVFLGI